ncbi:MAG TPA: hypothetical protein VJY35_14650 [Candidatus Eisenbacteria bacterium]|nr:hypothetical protein [Candidatus Eisenbacteria bacterium]
MRHLVRLASAALTGLAAAVLIVGPALAQQQTTLTKLSGAAGANGAWTRTITDVTEPNGPPNGTTGGPYNIVVPYTIGMTAQQLANAYRAQALSTLPAPSTGANGYGAVPANLINPTIRLSKQAGTYNFGDSGFPAGISATTLPPQNAEDAPFASPQGLAALAAGLSAAAWWHKRRRA